MGGGLNGQDAYTGRIIPALNCELPARARREGSGQQHQKRTPNSMHDTTHTLKGEGHDASEDGTGRGVPLVPVAFSCKDSGADATGDLAPTLRAMNHKDSSPNGGGQLAVVIFDETQITSPDNRSNPQSGDPSHPLTNKGRPPTLASRLAVRRLTPVECERLQGFPDHWTQIPYRGKPSTNCPDGPRYKAIGNSMAVPVMAWIGRRVDLEMKRSPTIIIP